VPGERLRKFPRPIRFSRELRSYGNEKQTNRFRRARAHRRFDYRMRHFHRDHHYHRDDEEGSDEELDVRSLIRLTLISKLFWGRQGEQWPGTVAFGHGARFFPAGEIYSLDSQGAIAQVIPFS
jgi:hypothetical protein